MAQSADRDANHALRARLDDVLGQYDRLRAGVTDLQARLAALRVTAATPDRLVRATVEARGRLAELTIEPGAYRTHRPAELAKLITRTVQQATDEAAERVEALVGEHLPAGSGVPGFLRDGDFGHLLARADDTAR